MIFTQESARKLLEAANVFFGTDDECPNLGQTLDLSDVWELACADGEVVTDEELPEVAELFWNWGWAGILYWVSKKDGWRKSEFLDNNRMIEFVRNEEKLREEIPDNNKRAYYKLTYTIGVEGEGKEASRLKLVIEDIKRHSKVLNPHGYKFSSFYSIACRGVPDVSEEKPDDPCYVRLDHKKNKAHGQSDEITTRQNAEYLVDLWNKEHTPWRYRVVDDEIELEDLEMLCDEKQEDIMFMLDIIRSIYARAGEDPEVARLCNLVLTESRITINAT